MELPSHEGEIPIPINSSYGHGHMIHHHHPSAPHNNIIHSPTSQLTSNNNGPNSSAMSLDQDHNQVPFKKMVKYRECLKNHAAAMGGNATDGCGEFMPSGEEGSIEALICSACNCHRNFHRKEIEGEQQQPNVNNSCDYYQHFNRVGRKLILGHHKNILAATPEALGYPTGTGTGTFVPSRGGGIPHQQMIMSYMGSLPSESDEQEDGGGVVMGSRAPQLVKKRFRTKFTQEQKEKMLNFAEKSEWKIQKQEEAVVQQFCQEIGIKRRVLKVWMHNNKHNLAKKNMNNPINISPSTTTTNNNNITTPTTTTTTQLLN